MTKGPPPRNLAGVKFGRLTPIRLVAHSPVRWECRCDCGKVYSVAAQTLTRNFEPSCGCRRDERARQPKKHGHAVRGGASSEYYAWTNMRHRCGGKATPKMHKYYAGRGIRVCERWDKFENFLADMGRKPGRGWSIDRIDNDGDYEPGNCRWATSTQQHDNQSGWTMRGECVVCPKCNARSGSKCIGTRYGHEGEPMGRPHVERVARAKEMRRANRERGAKAAPDATPPAAQKDEAFEEPEDNEQE